MLDQCQQHQPGDAELDDLSERISQALTVHAELEEKLFYPELRDRAEDSEERVDVFEAFTEHDLVKRLLDLLSSRRRNEDQFKAQLQVLGENVKHHVKEEESTIFKLAQELMDEDERETIGAQWERAKSRRMNAASGGRKKSPGRKKSTARGAAARGGARKTAGRKKAATGGRKKATAGGRKTGGRKKTRR